jgi:hypothetical protein
LAHGLPEWKFSIAALNRKFLYAACCMQWRHVFWHILILRLYLASGCFC